MDKFYFNGFYVRKKSSNIIVFILEILALPIIGLLMYGLSKIFPDFYILAFVAFIIIMLALYERYVYLNNKYNKDRGEFIQFIDNKIYYRTMNKQGEIKLEQVKEIIVRYPLNCLSQPIKYGSFIAIYADIILLNNKHKQINFELNRFSYHSNEKGFDFNKRERHDSVDIIRKMRLFFSHQAKKYHFTFSVKDKKWESQFIYLLKFIIIAFIFSFGFVFLLPLILFIRDTQQFNIIMLIELMILTFWVLLTGLAMRNSLRKFLRRNRLSSTMYRLSHYEEV